MSHLKSPGWVSLCVFVLALTVWFGAKPISVQTPEVDRTLEIERYPDEPLELIKLRVGTRSLKEDVKQKFKDNQSKWGIDSVKFKERDDWIKRLSITLRSTSDKPIYGLQGLLFLKPLGFPMMFSVALTHPKALRSQPLQPGAEVELSVDQSLLNVTLEDAKQQGADLRGAVASFSLEMVIFSDQLRWYRGNLVRPDTAVPNKWVPVNAPLAVKRIKSRINTPSAEFVKASFKSHASRELTEPLASAPPVFATCTQWTGSFQGTACAGDPDRCIARTDVDDSPNPGLLSHVTFSGLCVDALNLGFSCSQTATHTRLQTDSNCQVCPDADGDGFQAASCGGSDCNDTPAPGDGPSVYPGNTEICLDGIDNNCNGLVDYQDPCNGCSDSETDRWEPGGGYDCSLCQDGIDNDCDNTIDAADSGCNPNNCASPVLVDVLGNGFDLSGAKTGVTFDLDSDGIRENLSWTIAQTDDGWLALDRNGDGVINNGTELFGNFTPQANAPAGFGRNGFNALVEYDRADKGGNGDGLISAQDMIFRNLLLWQDKNHNGISEANELHTLKELGLKAIECDYRESKRRDQHGNLFRYAAKVQSTRDTKVGRWAWDVFLVRGASLIADNRLTFFDLMKRKSLTTRLFAPRTCQQSFSE